MRLALLLLLIPLCARAQGLAGSESVILHGFGGVSDAREGFWARELAAFGVAALVVESFTARGAGSSIDAQSRVSTAQGLRDAYAAPGYLARQPFVDPRRIGVMGMSWGGTVALRAADRRRQGEGAGFAASIPIYPGCVYRDAHHGFDGGARVSVAFSPQAQNYSDCVLHIEDDGTTTYARTGEALRGVKAFLKTTLLH